MKELSKPSGSILGGALMIAGSSIGAGMLALPVITAPGGFLFSLLFFTLSWLFMTGTAFCLLEVNCALGPSLSLISLVEKTLGVWGKRVTWATFLFLFYSLNVAYIDASGSICQGLARLLGFSISPSVASLGFTALFGATVYFGVRRVDHLNRALMLGLFVSYALLILLGLPHIQPQRLGGGHFGPAAMALPILIISFGFHNMIPSLTTYFQGDRKRLRLAIAIGGLLPLLFYLLFELVVLGTIPLNGPDGLLEALKRGEPASSVMHAHLASQSISPIASSFSLFAIVTSFLTQTLSMVDFLRDGFKVKSDRPQSRLFLIGLVLIPPAILALVYPGLFIQSLNMAGGFAAVVLFGAIPVLMVHRLPRGEKRQPKIALAALLGFSVCIFALQGLKSLGFL